MEVEPLGGKHHVEITERRTRKDWAQQIKQMLDERYPDAIKVRLVMDNNKLQTILFSFLLTVKMTSISYAETGLY